MGASASMFRKGKYVTEKDLDIIIDIFTKMKFYSSGIDKEKLSKGECFSISFTNDHWRRRWDDDDYQWDSLDDNDHIIIYFDPNVEIEGGRYIPSMGETVPDFLYFEDISGRGRLLLEFLHRYFKLFPEDVFMEVHFYTKDDIDKLYAKVPWNETWMYEDPSTFQIIFRIMSTFSMYTQKQDINRMYNLKEPDAEWIYKNSDTYKKESKH